MKEFTKYLNKAILLCEDYTTVTPESEVVDMIWFTPKQLRMFVEYCQKGQTPKNNKTQKT